MKVYEISKEFKHEEIETVICKNDGEVAYCNALGVDGTCKCRDYCCECSVAVIAKKENGMRRHLAVEH